jgi:hypothetical protein
MRTTATPERAFRGRGSSADADLEARGAWPAPERRATARLALDAPMPALVRGTHFARILNVSHLGALLETRFPLRPRDTYTIAIHFPGSLFLARATVLRCEPRGTGVDADGRRRVLVFVSGLAFEPLTERSLEALRYNLYALGAAEADPWRRRAFAARPAS